MRKLNRALKEAFMAPLESKHYQRARKVFRKIYSVSDETDDDFYRLYLLLKDSQRISKRVFAAHTDRFKTCNDRYINWLFSHPEVLDIYRIHDECCRRSGCITKH